MTWRTRIFNTLATALIAIIPATLGYCQARTELKAKWAEAQDETNRINETSYQELSNAVKELQDSVQKQHDDIIKLQVYTNVLEEFISVTENKKNPGHLLFYVAKPRPPASPKLTPPSDYKILTKKR